ncbi:MAG: hypothetical protein IK093_13060 [Ruminiclostridium sp.]|nr:hypothetical protein [Ruminiclostridium sp.]
MGKKKSVLLWVALAAVILLCGGVTVWSLFHFSIIRIEKPYEPKYIDIDYNDLGSAKYLDGKTAWVSIFASDASGTWDFSRKEDCELRDTMLSYYPIAAAWISEQAQKYGKTPEFVYAESSDDALLYCEAEFSEELLESSEYKQINKLATDEWDFIAENIDIEAVRVEYGCENVVFALFLNTPEDYVPRAMAMCAVDKPLLRPYEMIWVPCSSGSPAVIAHETLHTFGAIDLYTYDGYKISYHSPMGFDAFCRKNYPNDIMLIQTDEKTGERLADRISNEITDMTAYYIGWLDEPPFDVDGKKMRHSQYEKKKD